MTVNNIAVKVRNTMMTVNNIITQSDDSGQHSGASEQHGEYCIYNVVKTTPQHSEQHCVESEQHSDDIEQHIKSDDSGQHTCAIEQHGEYCIHSVINTMPQHTDVSEQHSEDSERQQTTHQ